MTPCPLCGHAAARALFEKEGTPYERCDGCALVTRGGPDEPPSYHDYIPDATTRLPPLTRKRYEELLGRLGAYRQTGRFLDVGCGTGFLVEVAQDLGWQAEGLEVSVASVEFGRERGLDLHAGTIEEVAPPAGAYDVVTMMEVIEHVPQPVDLLRQVRELLRPGGVLYLTCPNWGSLSRRVLGSDWRPIGRDHVTYFTPGHMRRALGDAGLRPLAVTSANVQPHDLIAKWKGGGEPVPSEPGTEYWEQTEDVRERIESKAHLRLAKSTVNAFLGATGTGDTLRALAVREL